MFLLLNRKVLIPNHYRKAIIQLDEFKIIFCIHSKSAGCLLDAQKIIDAIKSVKYRSKVANSKC